MKPRLRYMTENDLPLVLCWRNHPDIRNYMFQNHIISIEEHLAWYKHASQQSDIELLIFEGYDAPQGVVNIKIEEAYNTGSWGFYTAPDAPKGSGKIMGQLVLDYTFNHLELRKLRGQAYSFNDPSIGLHQSLGFSLEPCADHNLSTSVDRSEIVCFGIDNDKYATLRKG